MIDEIAARVAAVLGRAESLFAVPQDATAVEASRQLQRAADAHQTLGIADLTGAGVSGHRRFAEESASAIAAFTAADDQMRTRLAAAADRHQNGQARARALRADAAEVSDRLGPLLGTAAGDLAALSSLRTTLARMQQLLAEQSRQDFAVAEQIRAIDYRG